MYLSKYIEVDTYSAGFHQIIYQNVQVLNLVIEDCL